MADKTQVSLVDDYVAEYQGIQAQMGDPEVAGDQDQFRKLSKRYAELQPIINVYNDLTRAQEDHEAAAEMANEDKEFAEEAKRLEGEIVRLEEELADLLAPRDEHDGDDIIMELKAGAGLELHDDVVAVVLVARGEQVGQLLLQADNLALKALGLLGELLVLVGHLGRGLVVLLCPGQVVVDVDDRLQLRVALGQLAELVLVTRNLRVAHLGLDALVFGNVVVDKRNLRLVCH